MKPPRRLTLLATLCHVRQTEITDSLVDLFIQLVLKINTRAERKVEKELGAELKKVRGKEAMLLRVAEAALSEPSGTVRRVIFPVVGGEKTLKALAAEAAANEARYKARVLSSTTAARHCSGTTPSSGTASAASKKAPSFSGCSRPLWASRRTPANSSPPSRASCGRRWTALSRP
ncbi:hypothetical protein [Streptomyces sp. NPDC057375]|uniref:hypothetical protein n=1 Tax=Streptomyces sp. NPDC057375 TaxID=3346109 RepID=UPI003633B794